VRYLKLVLFLGLAVGVSGCHIGVMGIYGCTGEQSHKGRAISCPRCGNSSRVDRLRLNGGIEPLTPLLFHDWYCQSCKTWWRTRGPDHYVRGPGWPFKNY